MKVCFLKKMAEATAYAFAKQKPFAFAAKTLSIIVMLTGFHFSHAQTNYSFPITDILNSMPNGMRLPNGTIVKAEKVITGTGRHGTSSGTPGPDIGGTFTGVTLPAYVGDKTPAKFTVIGTDNTSTIAGGRLNNCQNSVGYRIYFDRATLKISFLIVDIDGNNTLPNGNSEWVTAFAFNGDTYVPYKQTLSTGTNLGNSNPTVSTPWKTTVTNTVDATAAANLPATLTVRISLNGGASPDDVTNQVLFDPQVDGAAVTNFFLLWGLWQTPAAVNSQTSGLSPIVVRVSPDFGDLPNSYKTLLASGGPSHGVVGTLALGSLNETKGDGQPSALANLDLDDDGVTAINSIQGDGSNSQIIPQYTLTTTYTNNTNTPANYVAWIDWNNNGTMEASEAQTATTAAASTTGSVTFTWSNVAFTNGQTVSNTYARIRTTTESITTDDVGGAFKDGEVEDYLIPVVKPLPLKLLSFTGTGEKETISLKWKTSDEVNTHLFEVERSVNGTNFVKTGEVMAIGSGNNEYNFQDDSVNAPANYYRLKMIDKDAVFEYSKVIQVNVNSSSGEDIVTIVPNPVDDKLSINIKSPARVLIQLFDESGRKVKEFKTSTSSILIVDCRDLKSGIYYVNASTGGKKQTVRILKK
ncbi:GEVED domain-containing protein [Pinibacter aurantiacus]|uniref:T9SS type A sorting domain-containing protein n=1 Tax=Pinibacter aurantiacus TaxID=2851599 RepID=A0A9E2S676_9BACT|nr:GEVED domain-containing protein [Pinibacter aurantiacus]MBV4355702.1 T9SS type A sorting domain-containing protein [Pinibacter aurantiacus]